MYWARSSRSALASGTSVAGVDVEPAVFPGVQNLHAFRREELLLDQEIDDLGAEEFFQRLERGVGQGWKLRVEGSELRVCGLLAGLAAVGIAARTDKQAVGHQSVDVGVELKIFPKVCSVMMMAGTPCGQSRAVRRYSLRLSWARVQSRLSRWRWRWK